MFRTDSVVVQDPNREENAGGDFMDVMCSCVQLTSLRVCLNVSVCPDTCPPAADVMRQASAQQAGEPAPLVCWGKPLCPVVG